MTRATLNAGRSFHAYARNEARVYEEIVAQDLGARVFADIFPALAQALAKSDLQARMRPLGVGKAMRPQYTRAYLDEVREVALILLYRLLFLFYAEDRGLLPVRYPRYRPYSVRRLRELVRDELDAGLPQANRQARLWRELQGVFSIIDEGEDSVGIPPYNGGLFDRARSLLLERTKVSDVVLARKTMRPGYSTAFPSSARRTKPPSATIGPRREYSQPCGQSRKGGWSVPEKVGAGGTAIARPRS